MPTITWLRDDAGFAPGAAGSFQRMEAEIGAIPCNSSYRDYDLQLSMYFAWINYERGFAPYPGHSRALHPDESQHCLGLAFDTARITDVRAIAESHGWFQVDDPSETHHFEYRAAQDRHRAGGADVGLMDLGGFLMALSDDQQRQIYEALVVGGGQYYKTDALINIMRFEISTQIASIAAGGILFPGTGYAAFPAIANAVREKDGEPLPVDLDEQAIANALAPLLAIPTTIGRLGDDQIERLAAAIATEQARRALPGQGSPSFSSEGISSSTE